MKIKKINYQSNNEFCLNKMFKTNTGKVSIQLKKHHARSFQLRAPNFPLHKPTPAVAPVIQCVVDTGRPILEAVSTVSDVPNSIENPRDGE